MFSFTIFQIRFFQETILSNTHNYATKQPFSQKKFCGPYLVLAIHKYVHYSMYNLAQLTVHIYCPPSAFLPKATLVSPTPAITLNATVLLSSARAVLRLHFCHLSKWQTRKMKIIQFAFSGTFRDLMI